MQRSNWIALIAIALITVLGLAVYFTFFFTYTCDDLECFQSHQKKCAKTKFINDEADTTWQYFIKGDRNAKCVVNVKVLKIKTGGIENERLVGKDMDCYLPLGSAISPESDITRCHGVLKEELQNMIIQKLYSYILENIGEIGEELKKAI